MTSSVYHIYRRLPSIRQHSSTIVQPFELPQDVAPPWLAAVRAAESKKATDIRVLDLRGITSFADYFIICTGSNSRQIQAISEAIGLELGKRREYPQSVEGFDVAEWVLADYGDYLVHVFSEKARSYYDLERLWNQAKNVEIPEASLEERPA